ncbi:MAG: TolC family protein [Anditalea sp.]
MTFRTALIDLKFWMGYPLLLEAWESVIIQRENVQLAEENEMLSRKKIEKGIIDMVQLKQIQQDLNVAQEKLNTAELDFLGHVVEINYIQSN